MHSSLLKLTISFVFLAFFMINTSGCGSFQRNSLVKYSSDNTKVIKSISVPRPGWINSPPEDDANYHYLVGLSNIYTAEKNARQDALRDARINYAHYTGIDVREVNKMFSSIYTSSATIFNPATIATENRIESVSVNVRKVKAKKWHQERLKKREKSGVSVSYQYWVLVQVPHDEFERVQQWKVKQAKVLAADAERKRLTFVNKLTESIKQHNQHMNDAAILVNRAKPLEAMVLLNKNWTQLYFQQKQLDDNKNIDDNNRFKLEREIRQAQRLALNLIIKINDSILIEAEEIAPLSNSTDQHIITGHVLLTWNDKRLPLTNFPIKLTNSENKVVATTTTNESGDITFNLVRINKADYLIGIDIAVNRIGLDEKLKNILSKNKKIVRYEPRYYTKRNLPALTPNTIEVSITSKFGDNQTYFEGDFISYLVSINQDAYLLIVFKDAAGNLIQITPSFDLIDSFQKAKAYIEVPSVFSGYQYSVSAPFGKETMFVYSSQHPFPDLAGNFESDGLYYIDAQAMKKTMEKYVDNLIKNGIAYGEAKTSITTMPRMVSLN